MVPLANREKLCKHMGGKREKISQCLHIGLLVKPTDTKEVDANVRVCYFDEGICLPLKFSFKRAFSFQKILLIFEFCLKEKKYLLCSILCCQLMKV